MLYVSASYGQQTLLNGQIIDKIISCFNVYASANERWTNYYWNYYFIFSHLKYLSFKSIRIHKLWCTNGQLPTLSQFYLFFFGSCFFRYTSLLWDILFRLAKIIMIESCLRIFLRNERCDSTKVKEIIFTNRMLIIMRLLHKLRTRTQLAHTNGRASRMRMWIERRIVRATQGRLLMIIIIILVLSSFHSCILADKPNVAQLTKTNCREWIWTSLSMSVCMCVSMSCMCKCVYVCV